MRSAKLDGQNMRGMDLRGVDFTAADLPEADLTGADLRGANFSGAPIFTVHSNSADLRGANFEGANLNSAILTDAKTEGAKIEAAIMPNGRRKRVAGRRYGSPVADVGDLETGRTVELARAVFAGRGVGVALPGLAEHSRFDEQAALRLELDALLLEEKSADRRLALRRRQVLAVQPSGP